MKVAYLIKMIEIRMDNTSDERYARNFDVSGSTLNRWRKGGRSPSVENIQKMAKFYQEAGDTEMLEAIRRFIFGDAEVER